MDEKPTIETKPIAVAEPSRGIGVVGIVIALAIVAAAGIALRQELLKHMQSAFAQQQETIHTLTQRVDALEAQTASLAALPHPDTAMIDGMHTDLGTAQATLAQLNDRIALLEKKPAAEPVKPAAETAVAKPVSDSPLVAFIKTGAPYQTELAAWEKTHAALGDHIKALHAAAATGLAGDDALRAQLTALLGQASAPAMPVADDSLLSRVNSHFGGLVTIKKQSAAPSTELAVLQALAPSAPLSVLGQRVEQLPAAAKPAFAPWLEAVHARDAALAELPVLDSAP